MTQSAPLIQCRGLTKVYPLSGVEVMALRGIDLDIDRGEMVAIMGPSGSGKSTLLNILGGMDRQTSGTYILEGVEVNQLDDRELSILRNKRLGVVFQRYNLLARSTALENVKLPLYYAGHDSATAEKIAMEMLDTLGISELASHRPNQMSGGQQQRVAIARALVNQPAVLLADEPTGALDSVTSEEIMRLFQEVNRMHGVTVVVITHEANIAQFCDRQVSMRDGLIVCDSKYM
ncbi:ABC transporter ATP-binding protein [Syntrophothermus lipocalidus]|uniref:ABC transporter related protein n=1 Tax=Syntrophothermus lipocalidus (strain DSM 12680 / TGB-C1) TaxID=643648 RepID=D7CIM7_SYNLT|nr:ABC transporter ATP-binding protein [Syntrophothermus lipocalidus]ADI00892.1 ABC transporter related protein [Syntrophothermus lipocalidus DSM 12680]